MKKIYLGMILVFLSACASPTSSSTQPPSLLATVDDGGSAIQTPVKLTAVEQAVLDILVENLGLDAGEVSVKSNMQVEFGDACMDIPIPEVMCAQVVTPGRVVVLEANGIEYEYHTSVNGKLIQPATLLLTWMRDGGIAGFCDRLTVFLSGEVQGTNCRSRPDGTAGTFAELLTTAEREQINSWHVKFGKVKLDFSDPAGVSDRMIVALELFGKGAAQPTKSEQQALIDWVTLLYQKLYS